MQINFWKNMVFWDKILWVERFLLQKLYFILKDTVVFFNLWLPIVFEFFFSGDHFILILRTLFSIINTLCDWLWLKTPMISLIGIQFEFLDFLLSLFSNWYYCKLHYKNWFENGKFIYYLYLKIHSLSKNIWFSDIWK